MSAPGSGEGAALLAEALARYGVKYAFGVVGVPVIEVGMALQTVGIQYVGCRNEQAASYAAGAVGYLTGTPGLCLVVSGPGVVHALAGLANSKENCWPMLVVGGSSDANQDGMLSFQESPQVEFARPYVKYAARFDSVERIPFFVERALRLSVAGRPGPVYLDMPGSFVNLKPNEKRTMFPPPRAPSPPASLADPREVEKACELLIKAKNPLIIVGKGFGYARAEKETTAFVEYTGFPYLPTPMGKGVVSDDHSQNVISARSHALKSADVVVLCGARLNWILHFGAPPRFSPNAKFIQLDVCAEAFEDNVPSAARLMGHAPLVIKQLHEALRSGKKFKSLTGEEKWWTELAEKVNKNVATAKKLADDASLPMNYYHPITLIQNVLEARAKRDPASEVIIVSEGANTMDIGRTILENYSPRHRLDAATYGSMGPALGQAMAAQVVYPDKRVVCLLGDSSFGFSAMEIETMCRYRMPVVIIIINNSGIAMGLPINDVSPTSTLAERISSVPVTTLLGDANARYEMMATAFGGKGYFITKPGEITPALEEALKSNMPSILNIIISPFSNRRQQEFDWLTREKPDSKM